MTANAVICPYCGQPVKLTTGKTLYPHRPDLQAKRFYVCAPCNARCGCHGTTDRPLGRLANANLRQARMAAHAAFDPIWQYARHGERKRAYTWLASQLGIALADCHIGEFDLDTCRRVISICAARNGTTT